MTSPIMTSASGRLAITTPRSASPVRHRQAGFSLIEMIVALVILSLSLGMLYQATAGATRNVRVDERYSYATLLAQSLLAQHATVPEGGARTGGTIEDYRWQLTTAAIPPPDNLPLVALHQLDVEVSWDDGGRSRTVTLTTIVPQTALPASVNDF